MPKTTMKSDSFAGQPVLCPVCGAVNSHLGGSPRRVDGTAASYGAVQVPVNCEPELHPFFIYVGDHKGEVIVWVDAKDYAAS